MKKLLPVLGLILASSAAAYAQSSESQSAEQSGYSQTPQTAEQAKQDISARKIDPLALQSSGPVAWNRIPGHEKGALTRDDVLPNSWLAENFNICDTDQDGKVSGSEYVQSVE